MLKFSRRRALALLTGSVAAGGLAAPAVASGRKIKVGALRFTSHSGSFIAKERGYFDEAGLDVEFEFFQAAQPMAVAIASGSIDYAITAISGALINLADKGAIKVIGGALQEEAGIDGQKYLISDAAYQSGIKTLKSLDDQKFALTQAGSSFHYMGAKMAAAENIKLRFTPLQKVGAIIGAMKSGQVAGWSIVPHIAKPLAASGAWHIVGNVSDYIPNYQVTTVFTSAKNAAEERAQTTDFLAGYSQGVKDYSASMIDGTANQDDMIDLIHKYVYTDRERAKAAPSIVNGSMRLATEAALNIHSVQDQLNWFKSEGLVSDHIPLDALVDPSYVNITKA
ncbi:NitT/TauT family transport system substrate-binding protein [Epibacterium ulvae]|uniref:NitT/TauT family transport system substrate-binding protein n=1 Tax=Epibacterium ulvae TaxID=1156985 RepID=A0A1G5RCB6_9RHOB|nr:ABC transporter substrate-binding protein [Epibacterium ulvae]SCZ71508.1 NitT/TauT family transport system substrate-binding protein [Epibacterium ulvae]